jgi:hypothetical protein
MAIKLICIGIATHLHQAREGAVAGLQEMNTKHRVSA